MLFKREEVIQRVKEVPAWIQVVASLLAITYFFSTVAIQYVYGCVASTLATIESDSTTAILRTSPADDNDPDATLPPYSDKEEDVKAPLVQQEVLLVKSKPITSSLRGTIRHLRSHGTSGFRGAGVALIYFVLFHWVTAFFTRLIGGILGRVVAVVVAPVILARLSMLWTHIVISEPSSKRWYQRAVPRSSAKKVLLPTFAVSLAQLATPMVPVLTWQVIGSNSPIYKAPVDELTAGQRALVATQVLITIFSAVLYFCAVVIPMSLSLVRVYAAQLPEDETPIVPFDRTFGGLVVSEAEGGNGKLMLKDAWKSFDWNGRVRVIKVWVKMTVMLCVTTVFFLASIGFVGAAGYHATKQPMSN